MNRHDILSKFIALELIVHDIFQKIKLLMYFVKCNGVLT